MPGKAPLSASSRKQIRQIWKSRRYPRRRPQRQQRRTTRVENFGGRDDLMTWALTAIGSNLRAEREAQLPQQSQPFIPAAGGGDHRHLDAVQPFHLIGGNFGER